MQYLYLSLSLYIYIYICIYLFIYTYIHIYIYIHIHIYIYTYYYTLLELHFQVSISNRCRAFFFFRSLRSCTSSLEASRLGRLTCCVAAGVLCVSWPRSPSEQHRNVGRTVPSGKRSMEHHHFLWAKSTISMAIFNSLCWLVVQPPLWIWVRQLGWWHKPNINGKHQKMATKPPSSINLMNPIAYNC